MHKNNILDGQDKAKLIESAKVLIRQGLSIIVTDKDKRPCVASWKLFQAVPATIDEIVRQLADPRACGIAVICGKVSGNVEVLDIDLKYDITGNIWQIFCEILEANAPGLRERLLVRNTVNNGKHIIYRCSEIGGNVKLAERPTTEKEREANPDDKKRVLTETKGEGGYFVYDAPGYEVENDVEIPIISVDERRLILDAARYFNQVEVSVPFTYKSKTASFSNGKLSPGDDYNQRGDAVADLIKHGWKTLYQSGDRTVMRRPGKNTGTSGDFHKGLNLFKVFSTSTGFNPGEGYTPFSVFAMLECNGNFSQAAKKLSEMDYGEKPDTVEEIPDVEFPYEVFPQEVQDYINCQTVQHEPLAVSILSAISAAIGKTAELYISNGRRATASINVVIVGVSGQKKSPALEIGYSEITKFDARSTATFKEAYRRYKKAKKEYEALGKSKNPDNDPVPPIHYQIIINNATMAMIALILSRNEDGCVLKMDELRGLFKKLTDPKTDDLEHWLSLYDGRTIRNQRKGGSGTPEQDLVVENPSCGVVGTTQPGFLKEMFGGANSENGMLFRFLFCFPESMPPERPTRKETPQKVIAGFHWFFEPILSRRKLTGEAKIYTISDPVFEIYSEWAGNHSEAAYNDNSRAGFWAKYENTCLRIALILQVMTDSQHEYSINSEISETAMRNAMSVMDYFVVQAWRALEVIRDKGRRVDGEYEAFFKSLPELFNQSDAEAAGKKYGKQPDAVRKKLYKLVGLGNLEKRGIGLYKKILKSA